MRRIFRTVKGISTAGSYKIQDLIKTKTWFIVVAASVCSLYEYTLLFSFFRCCSLLYVLLVSVSVAKKKSEKRPFDVKAWIFGFMVVRRAYDILLFLFFFLWLKYEMKILTEKMDSEYFCFYRETKWIRNFAVCSFIETSARMPLTQKTFSHHIPSRHGSFKWWPEWNGFFFSCGCNLWKCILSFDFSVVEIKVLVLSRNKVFTFYFTTYRFICLMNSFFWHHWKRKYILK